MPVARTKPLFGPAPHPGEVLKDELVARGIGAHALALALRLPASLNSPQSCATQPDERDGRRRLCL